MIRKLFDTIAQARRARAFDQTFKNVFDRPTLPTLRKWSTHKLHHEIANGNLDAATKSMAQSVLKSREAWYGPARYALIVAALSLLVSVAALWVAYSKLPEEGGPNTPAEASRLD